MKTASAIGLSVLLVFLVLAPWLGGEYLVRLLAIAMINVIYASGLSLILKMGHLSLGQAAFAGVGAYTSALISIRLGWPFGPSILMAGLVSGVVGMALGKITLNITGIYFSLIIFSLCEVFRSIYLKFNNPFGGPAGLPGIPIPGDSIIYYFFLILCITVATIIVYAWIERSRLNSICEALKQDVILAESVGVDTLRYKIIFFTIASFFTGVGGALFAHYAGYINPSNFSLFLSTDILIFCVVGGMGSLTGSIIGATLFTFVGQLLYGMGALKELFYGIILCIFVMFFPNGLVSLLRQVLSSKWTSRAYPDAR
jgi:branched-chain amino acid transport system permease protein